MSVHFLVFRFFGNLILEPNFVAYSLDFDNFVAYSSENFVTYSSANYMAYSPMLSLESERG